MNQYLEITYQKQLKLCTRHVKVDVQSILTKIGRQGNILEPGPFYRIL